MSAEIIRNNMSTPDSDGVITMLDDDDENSNGNKSFRNALLEESEIILDAGVEDNALRPQAIQDYLGQETLKTKLQISLAAAQKRDEPLEHILLYGPPGLGKTTMAMILANEMGCPLVTTSAPALERPRDIVGFLMTLEPNSIFFIDEIHRLNKIAEEILYSAMEDFMLIRTIGKGPTSKTLQVPLPPFTLVGATTKAGSLSNPLRDRFGMMHRMNYYSTDELVKIIQRSAQLLDIGITPEAANAIASRSRGTPRIVNRLLRRTRDVTQVRYPEQQEITESIAQETLDLHNIDAHGLDDTDRLLLTTLVERFGGGPAGVESLSASMGEDIRTLEDIIEPFLMQSGFIQRTPRGRVITPFGLKTLFPDLTPKVF